MEKIKKSFASAGKGAVSIKVLIRPAGPFKVSQHTLLLTRSQIKGIECARKKGNRRYKVIRMSRLQMKKNRSHPGGFLGFLGSLAARALPALAKGVATGLLGSIAQQLQGGNGLYLFKRGHCVKVEPVKGDGLYLRNGSGLHQGDHRRLGDGLYMRRGDSLQAVGGNGLILGPNSPFKSIPLLGAIL